MHPLFLTTILSCLCISFDFCFYFVTFNQCKNPNNLTSISEYNRSLVFSHTHTVLALSVFATVIFFVKMIYYMCMSKGVVLKNNKIYGMQTYIIMNYFNLIDTLFVSLPLMGYGINFILTFGLNRSLKWQFLTMMFFNSLNCIKMINFYRFMEYEELETIFQKLTFKLSIFITFIGILGFLGTASLRYERSLELDSLKFQTDKCEIISATPIYYFQPTTVNTSRPVTNIRILEGNAFSPQTLTDAQVSISTFYQVYTPDTSVFSGYDLKDCADMTRFYPTMIYKNIVMNIRKSNDISSNFYLSFDELTSDKISWNIFINGKNNILETFSNNVCLYDSKNNNFPYKRNETFLINSKIITQNINNFCKSYQISEYYHTCFKYECCEM